MNKKKGSENTLSYGVIGLGRFGTALARRLAEAGEEVIVVDCSEIKVKELRQYTENAYVADELSKEVLEEIGIQNCDTVIVGIGEKIDTCILTTLNVVNLGVPRVIAKAISSDQGEVLEKIGAEVIYPERDMALRLARRLLTGSVLDNISLNNNVEIAEVRLTEKSAGRSVMEMDLRRSFGLNIIALEHNGKTDTEVDPAYIFKGDELLVVIGKKENIARFEKEKQTGGTKCRGTGKI